MAIFEFEKRVSGVKSADEVKREVESMIRDEFVTQATYQEWSIDPTEDGEGFVANYTVEYPSLFLVDESLFGERVAERLDGDVEVSGVNGMTSGVRCSVFIRFRSRGDSPTDSQVRADAERAIEEAFGEEKTPNRIDKLGGDSFKALVCTTYDGDDPMVKEVVRESLDEWTPSGDWESYSASP